MIVIVAAAVVDARAEVFLGNQGRQCEILSEVSVRAWVTADRWRIGLESDRKRFEFEVCAAGQPLARATGRSKKEAEQQAAKAALSQFQ